MEKILYEIKSLLKTFFCFIIALLLLPVLLLSFICAHFGNQIVNYVLSIKYPNLTISKSKKIRSLIDTPKNAGIFHFLLQVQGTCDFDRIKQCYEEQLTELRDKAGQLRFPKLRQKLVTCWGTYAWVNDISGFNINNHLLLSTHKYRGRHVNDCNIQEFVSELATKYIPSDLPQWQVVVIPITPTNSMTEATVDATTIASNGELADREGSTATHYYILVKVHHLIIAEERDLHMSEMLLLRDPESRYSVLDLDDMTLSKPTQAQQLSHFVRKPQHIRNLLQLIGRVIVCSWQKFIYEFESLETPDGVTPVQITNITQLLSVLLIVAVNTCIGYWQAQQQLQKYQRRSHTYRHHSSRWQTVRNLMHREIEQRHLSWDVAGAAIKHSWQPANLAKSVARFLWRTNVRNSLLLPYYLYCELLALSEVIFRGQTTLVNTLSAKLTIYGPLLLYAQLEFFKICYELFKAPRNIYEVLFAQPTRETNILHRKSYSGRKIVTFTKSIDGSSLRKRNDNFNDTEVRESDFSLTCLAGAVHDYFKNFENTAPVPRFVNTTCRTVAKGYFTEHTGDKSDCIGGVVFLQLPLRAPNRAHAQQLHAVVEQIRHQQIMIYLASMGQTKFSLLTALMPHVLTKICINFFSNNFPITITEIYGATSEFQACWGQKVEDVLLFRPPQSKTCLSLNIHRFGDKYRLAIMADTQLGPDHTILARSFEYYMEQLTL